MAFDFKAKLDELKGKVNDALPDKFKFIKDGEAADDDEFEDDEDGEEEEDGDGKTTRVDLTQLKQDGPEEDSDDEDGEADDEEEDEEEEDDEEDDEEDEDEDDEETAKKAKKSKIIKGIVVGVVVLFIADEMILQPQRKAEIEAAKVAQLAKIKATKDKKKKIADKKKAKAEKEKADAQAEVEAKAQAEVEAQAKIKAAAEAAAQRKMAQEPTPAPMEINVEKKVAPALPKQQPITGQMGEKKGAPKLQDQLNKIAQMSQGGGPGQIESIMNKVGKEAKKVEDSKVYVSAPDYENYGRGLVYNCKEKYWACIDKASYFQCRKNRKWSRVNKKSSECNTVAVYATSDDCRIVQVHNVNMKTPTPFCK